MPKKIKPELNEGEIVIGRVAIYRIIDAEGHIRDDVYADTGTKGEELDYLTIIGMCADGQYLINREMQET